jgi:outer membrane protein insertion porin family
VFRPVLLLGGDLTLSVFQLEEDLESGIEGAPDNLRRQRGVELQQNLLLPDRWNLLYGYRFRRSTLVFADTGLSFPQDIAGVTLGAFRDTRDNVLDPHRGRFLSVNLTLAPGFVGSTLPFVKGFAQVSFVRPLSPTLLWAHGYRVGLGSGLDGQPMPSFERFRAGGPNSLRGFSTNEVGPRDFLGDATGGEAVVILNQELRWRHPPTGIGAVVFYDGGDVFETVGDLDLDWRHVLGVGLRYESPIGLLRFDWGFPLDPREGERSNRIHFSLGQAF